jgi:hypothetical protein
MHKFTPLYADEKPLKASHLDGIAQWALECSGFLPAQLFPCRAGGILSVESLIDSSGELFKVDGQTVSWGDTKLMLGDGSMGFLASGRINVLSPNFEIYIERVKNGVGFELVALLDKPAGSSQMPLYKFSEEQGPQSFWPVFFLGATPSLRDKLERFREKAEDTIKRLDPNKSFWEPLLSIAASLHEATPMSSALPILCSLSRGLNEAKNTNIYKTAWPCHEDLRSLLSELIVTLNAWHVATDPNLIFVKPLLILGGRKGRQYTKSNSTDVHIVGFENGAEANPNWGVAIDGNAVEAKLVAPSGCERFDVRFPSDSNTGTGRIRFRVSQKTYIA